ncbi:MAG: ATP synthase F1 subunit delta [Bacteroidales bacterium]|nr:ATP synthase F1 subunit delta [Bacteroidales bacterium]
MEDYRININYAKALFLVARDMNQLDAVCDDMRLVNAVCAENHLLVTVFANPVIPEGKKFAIVKDLFEDKITKVSMLFLRFVVRKRRSVNLKGISNAFIELYRNEKGIVLSHFVTASEPDDASKVAVQKVVGDYTHKTVELTTQVDPSIIGGFSVSFDGNMYDARISSQIAKLRKEFSKNVYESKL